MPLPLIPIISALAAGGTLVPHAAGGLIVTAASGYVAGTYVSTAAVAALISGGVGLLGTGAAVVSGAAATVIGGAGIFGTSIGATGLTGALMSAGLISSTPVWIPAAIGGAAAGIGYGAFRFLQLRRKLGNTLEGQEAQFTDAEAKIIERMLKKAAKDPSKAEEA